MDSVNVSVLLYVPVRNASLAAIDCWKPTDTTSLLAGPAYDFNGVGLDEPPTGANAPPPALAWTDCASAKLPLTSLPVFVGLGSATVSVASPAVLVTVAVVDAV